MHHFTLAYPAQLARQDGSVLVRFRDLPEALTEGGNRDEALAEAADCLDEAIAHRIAKGLEIPPPSQARRRDVLVPVPLPTAAKAALYLAMAEAGLSKVALAARLGVDEKEVRRLLDPRHHSRLDRLTAAIQAAGGTPTLVMTHDAA